MLAAVSTGRGIVGLQDALVLLEAGKGRRLGVEVKAVHCQRGQIHEGRSGCGDESSLARREDSRRRRRDNSRGHQREEPARARTNPTRGRRDESSRRGVGADL